MICSIRSSRNTRSRLHSRGYASVISSRVSVPHFREVKWIFSTKPCDWSPLFFRYGTVIEPLLSLFLNSLSDSDSLSHPLIHSQDELLSKELFTNRYALDFDGIIVLSVLFHVSIVAWIIGVPFILSPVLILVLLLFILDSCRLSLVLSLLVPLDGLCLELVQDVLYLSLELLI